MRAATSAVTTASDANASTSRASGHTASTTPTTPKGGPVNEGQHDLDPNATLAENAAHLARLLKRSPYPSS